MKAFSATALVIAMLSGGYALGQFYHIGSAQAQPIPVDAGVPTDAMVMADAGAPDAPPKPHTEIDDPVEAPGDFVGDMKTAKTKGWFAFVLVGLYGLCRGLGTLGKKFKRLAFLNKGRWAMIIAGAGTVVAAAIDALFAGGTLVSVGIAALWALVALMSPAAKAVEEKTA